jgi:hypothetical protein
LAISYDGKYQYAVVYNKISVGSVYTSSNYGSTWQSISLPSSYSGNIVYQAIPFLTSNNTTFTPFSLTQGNISNTNAVPLNIQAGTYVASGSTTTNNYWYAFDSGATNLNWASNTNYFDAGNYKNIFSTYDISTNTSIYGEYIQIKMPYSLIAKSYRIFTVSNPLAFPSIPIKIFLFGSNDGSNWRLLTNINGDITAGNYSAIYSFDLSSNIFSYSYYRLSINSVNGGSGGDSSCQLNRLDISGIVQNIFGPYSYTIAASGNGQYVTVANQSYLNNSGNLYTSNNYGTSYTDTKY